MTEEMRDAANAEIIEAARWLEDETDKIYYRLAEEQGANMKFDGGDAPYRAVHEEFARQMYAIGEKYGLLNAEQREHYEQLKAKLNNSGD